MIARSPASNPALEIWTKLAAPLPPSVISWRQDGKAVQRDGKFVARFVAYIDANTVRERLDVVVPGDWDSTLELLPTGAADATSDGEPAVSFKCRLQILGVIREDVGTGRDYKSAATDAFKRAATRFGIGHELYDFEQNWVQVDGDSRYAKPLEDPGAAYARRMARKGQQVSGAENRAGGPSAAKASTTGRPVPPAAREPEPEPEKPLALDEPSCPTCGGRMWDNRLSKRNPKAPDFKCRNRACDGVIWPPKAGDDAPRAAPARSGNGYGDIPGLDDGDPGPGDDDVPF